MQSALVETRSEGQSLPDEEKLGAVEFRVELSSMRESEMF
jgi:hypothetical protein